METVTCSICQFLWCEYSPHWPISRFKNGLVQFLKAEHRILSSGAASAPSLHAHKSLKRDFTITGKEDQVSDKQNVKFAPASGRPICPTAAAYGPGKRSERGGGLGEPKSLIFHLGAGWK